MKRSFIIFVIILLLKDGIAQWIPTNGPQGGRVWTSIGKIGNNIFTSVGYSGVFRTTNRGLQWETKNNGINFQKSLLITALATYQNRIFVGGDYSLFFSTNLGDSWVMFGNPFPKRMNPRAIAFKNNFIFVADNGIFRSSNNGITWDSVNNGLPTYFNIINDIKVAGNALLAASFNDAHGGIFRSSDNGEHWEKTFGNLGTTSSAINCFYVVDSNKIYAGTKEVGFLTSTNNGVNWVINQTLNNKGIRCIATSGNCIFIGIDFYSNFYGEGEGIMKSSDSGNTWNYVNKGLGNLKVTSLLCDSLTLYAGTLTGMYRSTNLGDSWHPINSGLNGMGITCIESGNNDILAGSDLMGIYKTSDGGLNWVHIDQGLTANIINKIAVSGDWFYAATAGYYWEYGGVYISSDRGTNWRYSLAVDEALSVIILDNCIFVGVKNAGIKRSTNNGLTWQNVNNGLPINFVTNFASLDTILFASSYLQPGIYRTTNKGETWTCISTALPHRLTSAMKTNGGDIYISLDSTGVYKSTDYGNSWTKLGTFNNNFSDFEFYQNHIFGAVQGGGVYHSSDGGLNWRNKSEGLWNKNIVSLKYNEGNLYAATYGASIWKRSISDIINIKQIGTKIPNKYELFQNYPNPFNSNTKIRFTIPINEFVSLKVFDIQGKLIKPLTNEYLKAGIYECDFDASDLPSSIYFYRLTAENFVSTRKMVLLK